jgi:hypothetical protein
VFLINVKIFEKIVAYLKHYPDVYPKEEKIEGIPIWKIGVSAKTVIWSVPKWSRKTSRLIQVADNEPRYIILQARIRSQTLIYRLLRANTHKNTYKAHTYLKSCSTSKLCVKLAIP